MRVTNQAQLLNATGLMSVFQIQGLPVSTKKRLEDIVNTMLDDATKPAFQLLELQAANDDSPE